MSGAESDERTILDYLNEDCWRAVLDYVPLKDMLLTEPASKRWQEAVLTYLRGARINIKTPPRFWRRFRYFSSINKPKWRNFNKNVKKKKLCRPKLTTRHCSRFENWTNKLGPSVVSAYSASADSLNIYENCPNLETLTLIDLSEGTIMKTQNENFKWLKRLSFKKCHLMSDRCVSKFMINNTLEQLEIHGNSKVTGKFLITKKSMNLKSLSMKYCWSKNLSHLVAASEFLGGLKKIELSGSVGIYKDIHLMLDKMPKLEHVRIEGAEWDGRNFFEAVCRLKDLKALCVDFLARDDDLEAVTRCCPKLKALRLKSCDGVTRRGLTAACANAGSRLVTLGVGCSNRGPWSLTDDQIVACIRTCPNLKMLNVRGNNGLTRELLARAAAARREMRAAKPLKLRCGSLYPYHHGSTFQVQTQYEELIILP